MDVMTILNGILVIFGLYMTAAGLRMKKTGELSPMLLAPEEIAACRDKDTFIRFMYWREAAFGGGTAILGVLGLVNDGRVSCGVCLVRVRVKVGKGVVSVILGEFYQTFTQTSHFAGMMHKNRGIRQ